MIKWSILFFGTEQTNKKIVDKLLIPYTFWLFGVFLIVFHIVVYHKETLEFSTMEIYFVMEIMMMIYIYPEIKEVWGLSNEDK